MIERKQDRAFLEWLQSSGVDHPKCGLAAFPDTGRGVVALQHIGCGELVVSVPDDATLLPDDCCIASVRAACLFISLVCFIYFPDIVLMQKKFCRSLRRLAWATALVPSLSRLPLCLLCLQRSTNQAPGTGPQAPTLVLLQT